MGSSEVLKTFHASQLSTFNSNKNTAMKHKSIFSLLIFLMGLGMTTTSCEDMLTPDLNRYTENFSGTDTVYFYNGILRNVQDMVEQNQLLGDLRSDLVATTAYSSDSVSHIIDFDRTTDKDGDNQLINSAAYYKVINQCNFYLSKVDTSAVKNNIYYMKREYAQVVNIRAWTYLQLVQTYGRVPFIIKPINSADTGWEKNPEAWATADNLVDLLKGDLEKAQVIERTLGYPQYGEFSTGNDNFKINCTKMRFYADVILGDLYLLRSNGKADYVAAAKNYYYFLKEQSKNGVHVNSGSAASFAEGTNPNGTKYYTAQINPWVTSAFNATSLSSNENFTVIPSAANKTFGRVLTRTAQIYGFDASSSNTTSSDVNGSSVTTSGQVNLSLNYKSRQVQPSNAYLNLCAAQPYAKTTITNGEMTEVKYYEGAGDARLWATAPFFNTKDAPESKARFIAKEAPIVSVTRDGIAFTGSFRHYKSIYRIRQIYLRYAEAINRAGYPRMAYAVLSHGLDSYKLPSIADSIKYDDAAKTKQTVYYMDSTSVTNSYSGAFFIGVDELRRAQADPEYDLYLNFSATSWNNVGIHQMGGFDNVSLIDSLNSYGNRVGQRIIDEANRTKTNTASVRRIVRKLRAETTGEVTGPSESETPQEPTLDELRKTYQEIDPEPAAEASDAEINAVESLIADECVLETAYEGSRMFDLIRFARHMNNDASLPANYGTQWLAWKIARRAENLAPYAQPSQYNGTLYNLMLNPDNWYISNPEYK